MKDSRGKFICHDPCYTCNHRTILGYTCKFDGIPKWIWSTDHSSTTCEGYVKRKSIDIKRTRKDKK